MTLAYKAEAAESRSGGRWLERLLNFWFYPPVHWIMQTRQFASLKRNIEDTAEDGIR